MKSNQQTIIGLFAIGLVALFLSGGWMMGSHMWGTGMMFGWGGMGWGMGFFWVLILLGLFLLFYDRSSRGGLDHAREILRERYARGEITESEFKEMMKRL